MTGKGPPPARLGVRAYAKHRGCAPSTVVKAIQSERIAGAVTRDARGHHPLIDVDQADRLWRANTDPSYQRERPARPARPAPAADPWAVLLDLAVEIEVALSAALRDCEKHAPKAPSDAWQAVYGAWARLPDALEGVQGLLRALEARA